MCHCVLVAGPEDRWSSKGRPHFQRVELGEALRLGAFAGYITTHDSDRWSSLSFASDELVQLLDGVPRFACWAETAESSRRADRSIELLFKVVSG